MDDLFTAVSLKILACLDTKAISRATKTTLDALRDKFSAYLWIVLDEAQIASEHFSTAFYTEQSNKKTENGQDPPNATKL
jgi:hypothetical protein